MGFRFETSGWWEDFWAETYEQIAAVEDVSGRPIPQMPPRPDLATRFTDAAGHECGKHRVTFVLKDEPEDRGQFPPTARYLVDSDDIGDLLHLIAACESKLSATP
jgi:hypothetical protein